MAKLILVDADKARVYGVPAEDTTTEAVVDQLLERRWPRPDAERHLQFAIAAGVYRAPSELAEAAPAAPRKAHAKTKED